MREMREKSIQNSRIQNKELLPFASSFPIPDNKSLPFRHFSIILGHSFRADYLC